MKNRLTVLLLSWVSFVCMSTHSAYCKSIADHAVGSDLQTIQEIIADTEFWRKEIFNCTCEATVSQESTATGERHKTLTYYGNLSDAGLYSRYDMRKRDGTTVHSVCTPKGSFSAKSRKGVETAVTSMLRGVHPLSMMDQFVKIAGVLPVSEALTIPDADLRTCKFTRFTSDSRDAIRIDVDYGEQSRDLMVEFTDCGRFVMTRYHLKLTSGTEYSGVFDYDTIDGRPAPRSAEVVIKSPSTTTKQKIEISNYKYGAVDFDEFELEAFGIEVSPHARPKALWIVLISFGGLILIATLIRLKRRDAESRAAESVPSPSQQRTVSRNAEDEGNVPRPRLKRLMRISLRTMLVVVTVLCVMLGMRVGKAKRQKEAVAWVVANFGTVIYENDYYDTAPSIPGRRLPPRSLNPLEGLFGVDLLADVSMVALTDVNDFSPLEQLPDVRVLRLRECQADLAPLVKLRQLEVLHLDCGKISDITPLFELAPSLRELNLDSVDDKDVVLLRKALPNCKINE